MTVGNRGVWVDADALRDAVGVASEPSFGGAASHRRFGNVLRDGCVVLTGEMSQIDDVAMVTAMLGRKMNQYYPRTCRSARRSVVLRMSDAPDVRRIACHSICVGGARVLGGLAGGLRGAGQDEICHWAAGVAPPGHGQRDGYDRGAALDVGGGRVVETHTGEDSGDAVEAAAHRS